MRTSSRYTFGDYDDAWPSAFADEVERLSTLLGDVLIRAHHIGSTSVPGLAAKPIIDLLPVVRSVDSVDALRESFEDAGYALWGEYGLPGRRYITKDRDGMRTHNIHAYAEGDADIQRHLAFRDYLRAHDEVRLAYAAHPDDISGYMDAKHDWIRATEVDALRWYKS